MKKILLFIALFFAGFAIQAQYVWVPQATGFADVSSGVFNVSAVDSNVVWISSYDGSGAAATRNDYSRTVDGGQTWVPGTTGCPSNYAWSMIHAYNADTAWAMYYNATAGAGGGIFFTGDGGSTWTQQGVGTIFNATSFPDVVYFWGGLQGLAMGDPNTSEFEIYTTTDAGTTWVPVPGANIPDPLAGEYGIVDHFSVFGNTIWFDTNKGRVYKSTDFGVTWTVASTGITIPANGAMDICFYDASNGLARLYNGTTGVNIVKSTNDGGTTWNTMTPSGNFWGSDVKYVPGTTSRLISTGAATGFIGSSYSDDGGLNWIDIETSAQRTALGVVDSNHIWAGGFTSSPTFGGIFKFTFVPPVACTDPSINTGITTANDTIICPGDTLTVTSTGVFAPNSGDYSGVSWVITSADITGNTDPLNDPSLIASYNFNFPAPATSFRQFINDGTFIGNTVPYGTYFWTPVVFGNAVAAVNPPNFLSDLTLDPTCTHAGISIMIQVLDGTDPLCAVGVAEPVSQVFSVNAYINDGQELNLNIHAQANEKAQIKIMDLTGRLVYSQSAGLNKGLNKARINTNGFGAGLYLVVVETATQRAVTKISKN